MKIKNIAFFGVMASILSVAGANAAATNETIIASKAYVDRSLPTKTSQLTNDSGYATTTDVNDAKTAAINTAATDATNKANAKVSSAATINANSTTTAPNEKAVSTALASKASADDLTSHTGNTTVHITSTERSTWNAKQNAITEQNKLPAALVEGALTSSDISGKANTDLGNITTAGNTVIQNQAKSVAANGTFSASTNYTDGTIGAAIKSKADTSAIPTKTSQLTNDNSFATTTQVATAKTEAINAAATDATTKANAARTNAVADVKTNLENTTTPVYDINAKSLKVNGAPVLTSHQSITGKANTDLDNLSDTGKANVSAQGKYSASTNYTDGTVGAAIKSKASASDLTSHIGNTTMHITSTERSTWNAKQNAITSTNKLPAANVDGLATVATSGKASDLNNDAGFLKAADISGKADKATNLTASGTTNKIVQYNDQGIIVAGTTAGSAATKNATDSYVATGTDVTTGKAVAAALGTLDVATISESGKPIISVGETNGKITASTGNINVSSVTGPTIGINTGETSVTCSSDAPCVLSYDGSAYSWTRFAY